MRLRCKAEFFICKLVYKEKTLLCIIKGLKALTYWHGGYSCFFLNKNMKVKHRSLLVTPDFADFSGLPKLFKLSLLFYSDWTLSSFLFSLLSRRAGVDRWAEVDRWAGVDLLFDFFSTHLK